MACSNCPPPSSSPLTSFETQLFYSNTCYDCEDNGCGGVNVNSKCIYYAGPNLSCLGIETNDSIEYALQKIDEQVCSTLGDYSNYNFNGLATWLGESITTEAQFINAITAFADDTEDEINIFITVTFPAYQEEISARIGDIDEPSVTCSAAGVVASDSLNQILAKYCTKFADLENDLSIASVNWSQCYTVLDDPENIKEGFDLVIDQICATKALITSSSLPSFNNTGVCLSGGTSNDSLIITIGLIKTRLCLTPTLDNDNLTSDCISIPATDTDLEGLLQNILDKVDALSKNYVTFDGGDFNVTQTDVGDECDGISVALATSLNVDRFVASNAIDTTPGTLEDKLLEGTGIDLDFLTSPGEVIIGLANGDRGDIAVTSAGATWTIDNDAVTFAKMQNVNSSVVLGRTTASSGDIESLAAGNHISLSAGTLNTYGAGLISITVFNSSATWTKPAGCNAVLVQTIGAGGGGGGALGATSQVGIGAGGGAGAHSVNYITSGLGATETVTVGTGGTPGSSGNSYTGQAGGDSSFGSHIVVDGGYGGATLAAGTSVAAATRGNGGGAPTVSGTTLYSGHGTDGDYGLRLSLSTYTLARGGSSILGGSDSGSAAFSGKGAGGYGAVESSGSAGIPGIAGADGIVIVYAYSGGTAP